MASQLQITQEFQNARWQLTAIVLAGGTLPASIFVYENTGTTTLGDYYGVADLEDLARMQVWSGLAIPVFGNRFVLYNQAKINVDPVDTPDIVIGMLINSVKLLSTALASTTTTQVINIP